MIIIPELTQHMQGAEYRWSKAGKLACIQGAMLNTLGYLTVFFSVTQLSTKSCYQWRVTSSLWSVNSSWITEEFHLSALNCKFSKFVDLWTGETYVSLSLAKDLAKISTQAPINKCDPAQIKVQSGFWKHLCCLVRLPQPHKTLGEHLGCLNDLNWKVSLNRPFDGHVERISISNSTWLVHNHPYAVQWSIQVRVWLGLGYECLLAYGW